MLDFFDARHFGRIGRKQASFHVFQLIFQIRNDGHEAGHDAVQDHAEQKVCLSVADLEHIFLQSRVDFVQHLGFFFDEREQEVLSLNDTKLLRQIIIVFFRSQLFQDDYIIIFMFFDFGQVICIQNILCDQKVDTEVLADFLHGFRVLQSVYLYPVDAVRLKMRNHFVNIFAVAVVYPLRIIRAEVKMSRSLADSRIVQLLTKQIVLCHSL